MEYDIYARVKGMSMNCKGAKQLIANELLECTYDNDSLIHKIEMMKEELTKSLNSEITQSSREIDIRLNLKILDAILKGD